MKITLHIEKLVVEGFPDVHREHIAGIVRRELARRLKDGDFASACIEPRSVSYLDAGEFPLEPAASTESLGRYTAGAVYQALTRTAPVNTKLSDRVGAAPPVLSSRKSEHTRQP